MWTGDEQGGSRGEVVAVVNARHEGRKDVLTEVLETTEGWWSRVGAGRDVAANLIYAGQLAEGPFFVVDVE